MYFISVINKRKKKLAEKRIGKASGFGYDKETICETIISLISCQTRN